MSTTGQAHAFRNDRPTRLGCLPKLRMRFDSRRPSNCYTCRRPLGLFTVVAVVCMGRASASSRSA
jgi:hypothetical protein